MTTLTALMEVTASAAIPQSAAAPAVARDIWVEVRINSVAQPDFALLHIDWRGHLFVRGEIVRGWHLRPRGSAEVDDLVRVDDVPSMRVRLDEHESVLFIEAEPSLFDAQVIAGRAEGGAPERGLPAVFVGYNLFAERAAAMGTTYSALVQAGSSLERAALTSSWLGTRVAAAGEAGASGWRRLDTNLLLDYPEYTARLMLGDGVTSPDTLGQSVRFAGVHWSTDYATRPAVSPYALPVVSGTATVPSAVELYVNQALVQRTTVEAGPFELDNVPVPLGQGTVDIRMRDILGQEQRLTVPYLAVPQLLAPGLSAADFAAGIVRESYGIESFSYRHGFLSAGVTHGVSDIATLNAFVEAVPDSREATTRVGASARVAPHMLVEWTGAVSHAAQLGNGAGVDAGVDALWRSAALGIHFRDASAAFVELGDLGPARQRLHREWAAQASAQIGAVGSLALVYASRRMYGHDPDDDHGRVFSGGAVSTNEALTASYNVSWRRVGALGVFVSDTRWLGHEDVIAGIAFTRYLGGGVTASITGTSQEGASIVDMRLGRAAPPDSGWGWNVARARGEGVDTDGVRVDARTAYGSGSGEIDTVRSGRLSLLAWQGGLLWAAGRAWPAQSLAGPAALIELPDLQGVEVLRDGQPAGRTDAAGRILVSGLRPFEPNTITVAAEDLPLSALVDSDTVVVRPYSRGVVSAVMGVAATESRLFVLKMERVHGAHPGAPLGVSGEPAPGKSGPEEFVPLGAVQTEFVPAGASVVLGTRSFPVGTQGIAQLPVAHSAVEALVSWPGGRCQVRVPAAAALVGPMDEDGAWPLACRGLPK